MEAKKEKMKTKMKGKAIIGIVMAAIMLASVFAAMAPMGIAQPFPPESYSGLYNNIELNETGIPKPAAVPVLIGQDLHLNASGYTTNATVVITGDPTDSNIAGEIFTVTTGYFDTSVMTKTGVYYANATGGTPATEPTRWDAKLAVTNPTMSIDLKVSGTSVSSITVGTLLEVKFTNNLNPRDMVSLVITDPDGSTIKVANGQYFDKINVSYLTSQYGVGTGKGINTTGWNLGDYKFKVATKKNTTAGRGARGLEKESNEKTLTIKTGEIRISADKTSTVELEIIKLTVTGVTGRPITIATSDSAHTIFPGGIENNPSVDTYTGFTDTIDADGERTYAVYFNDTGSYTIMVTDTVTAETDTVDITVTEKGVTFDMPATVVIGEKLMIKGTGNTGDWVQIAVDDIICEQLKKLVIAGNGDFEKEIDTNTACGGAFSVPGSVRLKAFIDTPYTSGQDVSAYTDDGSMAILMLETHLDAILSKAAVPPGDSFEVYGNASSNYVEIVAITPKGGNGTGMEGLYGVSIYTVPTFIAPDTFSDSETAKIINVSECATPTPTTGRGGGGGGGVPHDSDGDNFYKKIKVDRDADIGNYVILVLSPDRDKIYGNSSYSYIDSILDLDGEGPELGVVDVSNKTQEEIVAIIEDIIFAAGSDDFMWTGNIVVTQFDIFDTGESENPYPSIFGTHNGTIMPFYNINVSKMCTYSCPGTGGHTEYVAFYNATTEEEIANGSWNGYQGAGDYHHIEFDSPFVLQAKVTYNYTIKTGSYPQIIHAESKDLIGGIINCTTFVDANGKEYNNWIPAIRLE